MTQPSCQGEADSRRIVVGVSSCLLGQRVRYDGGHKADSFILQTLGEYFQLRPFCPEVDIGLGVPRKPMRLSRADGNGIRCVEIENAANDVTAALGNCADAQRHWHQSLCGYVLKKDSPSCGMQQVKVWQGEVPVRDGQGIYAKQLLANFPYLPVVEESGLGDAALRANFIQRVFALHRWQSMCAAGLSVAALMAFHARYKLVIMSHDQNQYRALGQLVAATTQTTLQESANTYLHQFMQALTTPATRGNHVNVLQHVQGYLKPALNTADKRELEHAITRFGQGLLPLLVPVTLLNHYFYKYPNSYIANSWYMALNSPEINLLNAV